MQDIAHPIPQRIKPRKQPVQARSAATVVAIREATLQVLLSDGLARLTTVRVAQRAGVSVGTLYQYFPNKEALLFAVLLGHFEELAEAFERLRDGGGRRKLSDVADRIADAYVSVKVARPDATTALYRVAGAIDQVRLPPGVHDRLETAVVGVLETALDAKFTHPTRVAFTLLSALAGLSRGSFSKLASETEVLLRFREDARILARAYLAAASDAASTKSC